MNDQQLEHKVSQDAARVKKDFNTLVGDGAVQFNRLEGNISQATNKAKDDLTTWVEDGASQLSKGFEKLTGDARETAVTMKKDVGDQLSLLNAKAKHVLHKGSDDAARKAAIYSWVAVSLALVIGFLVGYFLLKPARQPLG